MAKILLGGLFVGPCGATVLGFASQQEPKPVHLNGTATKDLSKQVLPTQVPYEASRDFFNGIDTPFDTVKAIAQMPGQGGFLQKFSEEPAKINVQVFALQHSGGDLLNAMLHLNFGNKLNYFCGSTDDPATNRRHGYWQHANVKEKWRSGEQAALKDQNIHALTVIRNPLSWLRAMRQAPPAELAACVDGDDWLDKPCVHQTPGGPDSKAPKTEYSSLEAVWNQWNDGFEHANDFGFERRIIVPYESLVRNPTGTMERVGNFLSLKPPEGGWRSLPEVTSAPVEGSDKPAVSSRDEVLRYMYKKVYLQDYTDKERSQACGHLDKVLQRQYGYDDCEKKLDDK